MTTPEAERLSLYNRLDDVLGKPHSDTLMSSLPLTPGSQLGTRDDLRHETESLRADMREFRTEMLARLDKIDDRFDGLYKTIIWSMVALTGIFSAIVGLIG